MSSSYPSDLSLDEFELIKAFCPEAKSGGRPRTTELWSVLNAIFYLVVEGCRWRSLPHDFPAWQTVYTYFRTWKRMNLGSRFMMTSFNSRLPRFSHAHFRHRSGVYPNERV